MPLAPTAADMAAVMGRPTKRAVPPKPKKPKTVVVRPGTRQDSFTTIETPAQIEKRVQSMATTAFNRERSAVRAEADRLRQDAEGRRRGLTDAYKAAAQFNAGMGADVQKGWEQAAGTIQGLAGTTSGTISDALAADLATQEQALSRVGAAGTGFDARSQAAVEAYRGGTLPAEYFTRMGGVGRQFLNESATALANRGLQEGLSGERTAGREIGTDQISQIKDLTLNRTKYESELREQLLGARGDQISAEQKAASDAEDRRLKLWDRKMYYAGKRSELLASYQEAKLRATTAGQKLAVDKWYKENKLMLDRADAQVDAAAAEALINQRNASAAKSRATVAAKGEIPKTWQDAWAQYTTRLDDVLDGRDPRFFTEDIMGNQVLKAKYTAGNNAKVLRDDLMRLVGNQYKTRFPGKAKDLAARAYAKAFAVFSIYKNAEAGTAAPASGGGGLPSIGG